MSLVVETHDRAEAAAQALTRHREARYLGGGTILMRAVNHADPAVRRVVRSTDPALAEVRSSGGRVEIGAGVTMAGLIEHRDTSFLAPVARRVGGPAVREMATVGGNLFAEHPYGDLAVALLALGATVRGADGRDGALADLLAARERGGLVLSVSVERPSGDEFRFAKLSRVRPKGVSVMSLAAWLPRRGGRVAGARVAWGAMAPTPVRSPAVERALEGRTLDPDGVAPALAAATEGLDPPTDALATEWWRREVAPVELRRLLLGEADP